MILNVINNKNERYSIIIDKDDNSYVEMCVFIKYKKIILTFKNHAKTAYLFE